MAEHELEKRDSRYHENFLKKLGNGIIVGVLDLISRLPFRVIYLISDFFYVVVRFIIRYRRTTILSNLRFAFPEKTEKEIKTISSKFYRHFCDFMLETIKMHNMSKSQMEERLTYTGLELLDAEYKKGRGIIVLAMHHNNWEWCSALKTKVRHKLIMLYNPVRGNRALERFILESREKWGGKCVPVHKSGRILLGSNREEEPAAVWLSADQTPPAHSQFWTIFLNREAPFFSGPEKIAARTNQPVFFHHTRKTGRGKYEVIVSPLIENPAEAGSQEILLKYVRKMEEMIKKEPEFYLWSHRRWKHTRPEDIPLTI